MIVHELGILPSATAQFSLCEDKIGEPLVCAFGNFIGRLTDLATTTILGRCRQTATLFSSLGEYARLSKWTFSSAAKPNPYCSIAMARDSEPDVQVESWLKTLGMESLCQWDVLVFHHRHLCSLISAKHIARFLGYTTAEVVVALDSLESSGLVERSRVSQGVRLYQVTASPDAARRDALEGLMTLAVSHTVRPLLARRREGQRPT